MKVEVSFDAVELQAVDFDRPFFFTGRRGDGEREEDGRAAAETHGWHDGTITRASREREEFGGFAVSRG